MCGTFLSSRISLVCGFGLALVMATSLFGCNEAPQGLENTTAAPEVARFTKMNVNQYPLTKTVCDPFGGQADPRSNAGLKAELFYVQGQSTQDIKKIQDVITRGKKSDRNIFLGDLIIPTRRFELGFSNQLGETIQDDQNQMLIEWFALRMKTVLKIRPDQAEGIYEFASLSDDGSVLKIRGDNGLYGTVVDNDGTHPTRLACGTQTFDFKRDSERLAQVLYHQGPRFHISMVLLMRKVSESNQPETSCGLTGNKTWFDYDKNSAPQKPYQDLLARGWEPMTRDNFSLPNDAMFNPCKEGEVPVLSDVTINETTPDTIKIVWTTNIPATSQLSYKASSASTWEITSADNILRTEHAITLNGLASQTQYDLRPVSISDTYGRGVGAQIQIATE